MDPTVTIYPVCLRSRASECPPESISERDQDVTRTPRGNYLRSGLSSVKPQAKKKARCCGPLVLIWRRSVFAEPKTQQMQKVIEEHEDICEQPGGGDDVVSFPALNNALRLPDNPAAGEQDKHD